MLNLVRPQFFIPVHGEYRHLLAHAPAGAGGRRPGRARLRRRGRAGDRAHQDRARACSSACRSRRVLVDGKGVGDVGPVVLRDRAAPGRGRDGRRRGDRGPRHRRDRRGAGDRLARLGLRARGRGRAGGGEDGPAGGPRRASGRGAARARGARSPPARHAPPLHHASATTGSRSCCRWSWKPDGEGEGPAGQAASSPPGGSARPRASSPSGSPRTWASRSCPTTRRSAGSTRRRGSASWGCGWDGPSSRPSATPPTSCPWC